MSEVVNKTNLSSNDEYGTITDYNATTSAGSSITVRNTGDNVQYLIIDWQLPNPSTLNSIRFDSVLQTTGVSSKYIITLYAYSENEGWVTLKLNNHSEAWFWSSGTFNDSLSWTGTKANVSIVRCRVGGNCGSNGYTKLIAKNLAISLVEPDIPEPPSDTDSDIDLDTDVDADVDIDTDTDADTDTDIDSDIDSDTDIDIDSDIDNDLDTDSDTDTDIDTDNDTDDDPYPDWFDQNWYDPNTGRVYKDILINNFNAIEEEINKILAIDITDIAIPDIKSVEYPDVSLSDEDSDSQVLNLKSFLNIVNLINYPLVIQTDGNTKILKVEYWGDDLIYHIVRNTNNIVPDSSEPYVYLDFENHTIIKSDSYNTPQGCVLIGIYTSGGKFYTRDSKYSMKVDTLSLICGQDSAKAVRSVSAGGSEWGASGNVTFSNGSQTLICYHTQSKNSGGCSGSVIRLGLV